MILRFVHESCIYVNSDFNCTHLAKKQKYFSIFPTSTNQAWVSFNPETILCGAGEMGVATIQKEKEGNPSFELPSVQVQEVLEFSKVISNCVCFGLTHWPYNLTLRVRWDSVISPACTPPLSPAGITDHWTHLLKCLTNISNKNVQIWTWVFLSNQFLFYVNCHLANPSHYHSPWSSWEIT